MEFPDPIDQVDLPAQRSPRLVGLEDSRIISPNFKHALPVTLVMRFAAKSAKKKSLFLTGRFSPRIFEFPL
jgi:hypothetical protein